MVNSEELSELKLASGSSSGDPSADLNHAAEGLSDQLRNVGLDEVAREESNSRNEGVDSKGAGNNQEEEDGDGWGESEKREVVYPLRPGAEDCSFYMRTGSCKFNHPLPRKIQIARDKVREKEEDADKLRLMDCKYYMRTGGCKYGETCRFNHTKPKSCLTELNFLGLPIALTTCALAPANTELTANLIILVLQLFEEPTLHQFMLIILHIPTKFNFLVFTEACKWYKSFYSSHLVTESRSFISNSAVEWLSGLCVFIRKECEVIS